MELARSKPQIGVQCFFALNVYVFKRELRSDIDGYTIMCGADEQNNNCANTDVAETQGSKTSSHLENYYILWELIA